MAPSQSAGAPGLLDVLAAGTGEKVMWVAAAFVMAAVTHVVSCRQRPISEDVGRDVSADDQPT